LGVSLTILSTSTLISFLTVHNGFVGCGDDYQRSSVNFFIGNIPSFAANSQDRERHLAVRCCLLAPVLYEAPTSFAATIIIVDEQGFMDIGNGESLCRVPSTAMRCNRCVMDDMK
jgi:hypothetical protein